MVAEAVPVPTPPRQRRANFVLPRRQSDLDEGANLEIGAFVKTSYQKDGNDTLHLYQHKKNKLRVVLAPKSSNVCALSVCFLVGSKAETLGTTGSGKTPTFVFTANFCIYLIFS